MSRISVKNITVGKELLWRRINIRKSLDDICHTFEAEIHSGERPHVRRHDKIEVRYENALVKDSDGKRRVTTVLIDEITAGVDITRHSLIIIGRSPARDIIDSSWDGTLTDMTLREIVKEINGKFGIACDTFPVGQPDPTAAVPSFTWENESPWTKLVAEAESQGYILTGNEAGDLYLWKVAVAVRPGFNLTEGLNIKSVEWTENGAEQFHEYIFKGGFGDPASVIDTTCKNNRVLTINIPDPEFNAEKLKRGRETEMRRRKENRIVAAVSGCGLTDGQIRRLGETEGKEIFWVPNILVPVKLPSLGLERDLLVAEVQQEVTHEIMTCSVTLVNREAYL
jgi:prophage tail gpP-like protein